MSAHTPEPMHLWRPEKDEYPEPHPTDARLVGADGLCYGVLFGMVAESRAMQPRIVACVNACAGIADPESEIPRLIAEDHPGPDEKVRILKELTEQRDALAEALRKLIRGYVSTLESARDRIAFLGGDCDSVEKMERDDPHLREARAALAKVPA